jgi:hypothetical protein
VSRRSKCYLFTDTRSRLVFYEVRSIEEGWDSSLLAPAPSPLVACNSRRIRCLDSALYSVYVSGRSRITKPITCNSSANLMFSTCIVTCE